MFKKIKSTFAFAKINEMLVGVEKDEDGNYKLGRYQYNNFVNYLEMLDEEHSKMVYDLYGIELSIA